MNQALLFGDKAEALIVDVVQRVVIVLLLGLLLKVTF